MHSDSSTSLTYLHTLLLTTNQLSTKPSSSSTSSSSSSLLTTNQLSTESSSSASSSSSSSYLLLTTNQSSAKPLHAASPSYPSPSLPDMSSSPLPQPPVFTPGQRIASWNARSLTDKHVFITWSFLETTLIC